MSDFDPNGNAQAIRNAKRAGFSIVRTAPNLLLLDLDDLDSYKYYLQMLPSVREFIGITKIGEWKSKSGEGRHVVLQLDRKLPMSERMVLQAVLGSDRKRELYNLKRKWDKDDDTIVLFKPKKIGTFSEPASGDD